MVRPSTVIISGLILLSATMASAQPWMETLPASSTNFYDIQASFNRYWEGRDTHERGKGWKAFKRWEWFWEQRVFPTGAFPDPMQLYRESADRQARRAGSSNLLAGSWSSMGPSQSPGGYAGLGRLNCVRVSPANPNTIWVGSASGGLWKSTNGGVSWSTTTDELPTLGVTDIAIEPSNPAVMYIATGDGDAGDTYSVGVLKSTDGGATWTATGLNWAVTQTRRISRLLMDPSNSSLLIAATSNGIHKTTNGGTTWTQVSTTSNFRDLEFRPSAPATAYASRSNGQVYRSTNTGDTWTLLSGGIPTSGSRVALGVTPANADYVYALYAASNGGFSALYRSTDSGTSWVSMSTTPNLLGWDAGGGDVGGQGSYDLAVAVSQSNPDEVYVGGVNNWKSTDGGVNWSIISMWYGGVGPAAVHADQHDLSFVPGTTTLYAGNDGGIYRTVDGGTSWTWLGGGLRTTQFYKLGVSQTDAAVLIAGAQDNGTKALSAGVWDDVIGGDGMECAVDFTNASIMYGSIYYGAFYKSINGGASFFPITGSISEQGAWVTPFAVHPTDPAILFAGYTNVWKSTDAGGTWGIVGALSGGRLDNLVIAPSNPDVIYLSDGATLIKTTNGGAGWSTITSPTGNTITSLAIHPTNPDIIWLTASGYAAGAKVYVSTNGGSSWSNISGTLPNVPANTIVYENGSPDRLYVGTDIGVHYRDNTVSDWQDFNGGLPNVVVSELEIQYSAGKLRAATYGRGVWESDLFRPLVPLITATPDSFSATIAPGDSATGTLLIVNAGGAALNWNITVVAPGKKAGLLHWIAVHPQSGSIPSGGNQPVTVTMHAVGPDGTTQLGSLQLNSNDSTAGLLSLPVRVVVAEEVLSVGVGMYAQWNMVSAPLVLNDFSRSGMYPTSISPLFRYVSGSGYQTLDTLVPGEGYWLKFPAAQTVTLTGHPIVRDTSGVAAGWNLVGSISTPVSTAMVTALGTSIVSPFYGFDATGFAVRDTLLPGRGYWVKVSTGGGLILTPGPAPAVP
jgi:photosystem II stability/assembly factor-like uncharacterized protein